MRWLGLSAGQRHRIEAVLAIAQAFAAYGMSFLFVRSGGDDLLLFALGWFALVLAVVLVMGAIGGRS